MNEKLTKDVEELLRIQKKLERCSLQQGRLKNLNYLHDWEAIGMILQKFGIESDNNFYQRFPDKRDYFNSSILFDERGMDVCKNIVSLYKAADYIPFDNLGEYRISKKEREEIMCDYLDYMMPNGSKMLIDLVNNGRLLLANLCGPFGETYSLSTVDDSFIFIEDNIKDFSVSYMKTIIHELMHKYGADKARISTRLRDYLDYTPLTEILSLYSEFSFSNYLKDHHIHADQSALETNSTLQIYLEMLKDHYSMLYCDKNGGDIVFSTAFDYIASLPGNVPYLYDDENQIYSIGESNSKGTIYNFNYILGFIKSMDLLRREKEGENIKKMIDQTLFEFDSDGCDEKYFFDESNYDFITNEIKTNTDDCKKLYKMK